MLNQWQLQEAKNKFSQVVKQAQRGEPQYIYVHGKPTAVVISFEEYQKTNQPQTSLSEVLIISLIKHELDLARDTDQRRDISFD